MIMEWTWAKANEKDLAKFVNEEVKQLLPKLPVDPLECHKSSEGRKELIKAIYDTLISQNITYSYEKYQPEQEIQQIRTPKEILEQPKEGTCLDLSILFCGLCFAYDLLPLLIVIDGHALAAVSIRNQRNEWDEQYNILRNIFNKPEIFQGQNNLDELKKFIQGKAYIAVECTGFAHTKLFTGEQPEEKQRQANGTLSFDRACDAGLEQLSNSNRDFKFAIDIATAQYSWKIKPLQIPNLSGTLERLSATSEIRLDNTPNAKATGNIIEATSGYYNANISVLNSEGVTIVGNEIKKKV